MARPGEVTYRTVKVLNAAGAGVAGLTIANFTTTAWSRAYGAGATTAYAAAPAVTDLTGGWYELAFTLPASAGWWRFTLEHATNRVWNGSWEGEVETQDWDSLYGSIVQPIATLSTGVQLGMPLTLELVKDRFRTISIAVKDSAGNPYNNLGTDFPSANLKMSVRSKDMTTVSWQAGPSGTIGTGTGNLAVFAITTAGNLLNITLPEDCSFFSGLAAGTESIDLQWEVTGDYQGNANQTQPIIRYSTCRVTAKVVI